MQPPSPRKEPKASRERIEKDSSGERALIETLKITNNRRAPQKKVFQLSGRESEDSWRPIEPRRTNQTFDS